MQNIISVYSSLLNSMKINCSIYIHTYIYIKISSLLLEYHKLSFYVVIIHSTFSVITRYQIDIVCNTLNNLVSLSRKLKDYRLRQVCAQHRMNGWYNLRQRQVRQQLCLTNSRNWYKSVPEQWYTSCIPKRYVNEVCKDSERVLTCTPLLNDIAEL